MGVVDIRRGIRLPRDRADRRCHGRRHRRGDLSGRREGRHRGHQAQGTNRPDEFRGEDRFRAGVVRGGHPWPRDHHSGQHGRGGRADSAEPGDGPSATGRPSKESRAIGSVRGSISGAARWLGARVSTRDGGACSSTLACRGVEGATARDTSAFRTADRSRQARIARECWSSSDSCGCSGSLIRACRSSRIGSSLVRLRR